MPQAFAPRIYLAGPTVFMPEAVRLGASLKRLCESHQCVGLFPLDANLGAKPSARDVFAACMSMLGSADAVVADLSPFRGPHVDDGTAFELGVATNLGLPIFGYSSDLRVLAERIEHSAADPSRDSNGIEIENFGQPFNAMISGSLGAPPFGSAEEAIAAAAVVAIRSEQRRPR